MKQKLLWIMLAAGMVILQSCSKNKDSFKSSPVTNDPIASSTGLKLNKIGDWGVFACLTADGKAAQVTGNAKTAGATIELADNAGTSFQKWKITKVTDRYFTLQNIGSGLYAQSFNYNGTYVVNQNKANGTDAQLWALTLESAKTYKAINKASGLAITADASGILLLKTYSSASNQIWGYNQLSGADTARATRFGVASPLQSNMVVQRDKPFNVWGKASPYFKVTVKASWNPNQYTAVADAEGDWLLSIPAAPVNTTPQTLTASVNGQAPVTLNNLLIGDVWICSGQSNMEMPVDSTSPGLGTPGILNYKAEIAAANFPQIRHIKISVDRPSLPRDTVRLPAQWTVCTPQHAGLYSAVAYFFARTVNTNTNIPIGIVVAAHGGSSAWQWTSKPTLESDPILAGYYKGVTRATLYNGMIYPLRKLSIAGFTWYQGESNRDDKPISNYTHLTSMMVADWRKLFNQGDLPFYYVQVAPFANDYFSSSPWGGNPVLNDYAFFREGQAAIKAVTPKAWQAITMDVGDALRIHPLDKRPVGERLGLLALKNTYGKSIKADGPQYASWSASGDKATISFVPGTATGLTTKNNTPIKQYFFVAGTDRVFRQATAVISGEQVVVAAPAATPLPIQAVRYAFTNFPITNLQNSAGLPMEAFRTDDWTN